MAILIKEGAIQFQYLEGIEVSNCLPSGESHNIGQAQNLSNKTISRKSFEVHGSLEIWFLDFPECHRSVRFEI